MQFPVLCRLPFSSSCTIVPELSLYRSPVLPLAQIFDCSRDSWAYNINVTVARGVTGSYSHTQLSRTLMTNINQTENKSCFFFRLRKQLRGKMSILVLPQTWLKKIIFNNLTSMVGRRWKFSAENISVQIAMSKIGFVFLFLSWFFGWELSNAENKSLLSKNNLVKSFVEFVQCLISVQ